MYKPTLSDAQKEAIIVDALESDEGQAFLAKAMVEITRRNLEKREKAMKAKGLWYE